MSSFPANATSRSVSLDKGDSGLKKVAELIGRVLLAAIFLLSGLGKIGAYAGTAAYMSSLGVPGALLPVVIATEVLGALAIIVGWNTRVIALLLGGVSLLTARIFPHNFGGQIPMDMFLQKVS